MLFWLAVLNSMIFKKHFFILAVLAIPAQPPPPILAILNDVSEMCCFLFYLGPHINSSHVKESTLCPVLL